MTAERRIVVAITSLIFGLTASMTYLCERFYERLHYGRANPPGRAGRGARRVLLASFFIAAWWAGFIAIIAYRPCCRIGSALHRE